MSDYYAYPLWLLLSCLGLAASALPRRVELWLGRRLGDLLLLTGLKVRIAKSNIALCFPDYDEARRRRLLKDNYEHYGIMAFEFAHFFSPIPGHFKRYAQRISRLANKHLWEQADARGKGVLFFSAHMSFWEMSAAAAGLAGMEPTVVTTILKPAWLHERITRMRASVGVSPALHPGSMPTILRALRKGGMVAFMNDQYARSPMGIPVVFFGMRVQTLGVVGPLAKRTGAAVLPVCPLRGPDGVVTVTIEPELDLGAAVDDATEATQRIAKHVEGWVRRNPEQWLWIHRRFKHATPAARDSGGLQADAAAPGPPR